MKSQAITEDDDFEIIDLTQPSHRPIAPLPYRRVVERQGSILDHPRIIAFTATIEKLPVRREAPPEVPQKDSSLAAFPLTEADLAFVNEVDDEMFRDIEKTRKKERLREEKRRKREAGQKSTLSRIAQGVVEIVDVDEVIVISDEISVIDVDEDEDEKEDEDNIMDVDEDFLILDEDDMVNEELNQTHTASHHPPSPTTSPSVSSPLSSFAGVFDDDPEPFPDLDDDIQTPAVITQAISNPEFPISGSLNHEREISPTERLVDERVSPPSETLEDERVNCPPILQEDQHQSAQNESGIRHQRGDSIQDQNNGISWSSTSNVHIKEVTAQPNEEAMTFSVKKELLEVMDRSDSMGTGLDNSDLIDAAENGQSMDIEPRIQDRSTQSSPSKISGTMASKGPRRDISNGTSSDDQLTLPIDNPGPSDPAPSLSEKMSTFENRSNHLQTHIQRPESHTVTHVKILETPVKEVTTSSSLSSPSKAFTQFTPSSTGTPSPTPENSLEAIDTHLSPSGESPPSRLDKTAPAPNTNTIMTTTPSSNSVDSPKNDRFPEKPKDNLEKGDQGTPEMRVPRVTGNYLPTPSPSPIRPHSELPSAFESKFTGHSIPGHTAWSIGRFC